MDLNIGNVWDNYTGRGVHVGVYDSGVQANHPDLDGNYDASRQISFFGATQNQTPGMTADDAHGTAAAGIIASEDNVVGTKGVAYNSSVTGVQVFGSNNPSDGVKTIAMLSQQNFDVVNHSWGYWGEAFLANVNSTDTFWKEFFRGIDLAADNGRGGLGTVMVIAAGNNREGGSGYNFYKPTHGSAQVVDTNAQSFTNDRHMVTVAAVDHNGRILDYSTPGASVLVSGFSGSWTGSGAEQILTTDLTGAGGWNNGGSYTGVHGTSFAAPQVTGIVALMLEANPDLGWRDVREILAYSARQPNNVPGETINKATTWNGGGLHFSNDYGFGIVDAHAAVRLAETWGSFSKTSANEKHADAIYWPSQALSIPDLGAASFTFNIADSIKAENVGLFITGAHTFMRDLEIKLVSPGGTESIVLNRAGWDKDMPANGWTMTSNAFLGELGKGQWKVVVTDKAGGDVGAIAAASLNLYGSSGTEKDTTYVYTDDFAKYGSDGKHSFVATDSDGGTDTINASALTGNTTIDLDSANGHYIIAGKEGFFGWGSSDPASMAIETVLAGDGNDTIGGNFVDNFLFGGRGNDKVMGREGSDYLFGHDGIDILDGGTGADFMDGGADNDVYVVDNARDVVGEGTKGFDTVRSYVSYVLSANVEYLTLMGTAAINGTGNILANALNGNGAANTLRGAAANDGLDGGGGNDRLDGGLGRDFMLGGAGADDFDYNSIKDTGKDRSDARPHRRLQARPGRHRFEDNRCQRLGRRQRRVQVPGQGRRGLHGRQGPASLAPDRQSRHRQ